jgi:type II secretory ATPase GspE/PulE/Tfp pilus assembly ATPase PilB-like protein
MSVLENSELPIAQLEAVSRVSDGLTAEYLAFNAALPIERSGECVLIATWLDQIDEQVLDDLREHFHAELKIFRAAEGPLRTAIQRIYGTDPATAEQLIAGITPELRVESNRELPLDDLVNLANEAPVVRLVNALLVEALEARASDVHLEMYAAVVRVRYRVDGVLQDAPSPPLHLAPALVSRLKIMSELDIAERRIPQDGRLRLRFQDRQVDVRISTLPTLHGESVVLRLLDKSSGRIGMGLLGMSTDTLATFTAAISRPHGIVLATGPTGSGKTTTLYAAVDHIRTGREKILTVEDPVEYELVGVPQVPVNERAGVTFATALRALLRQDPDVLLVGEIRDQQTAAIATQAALTGHLVLSTLHTNDAAGALTRLVELDVAPFLVASTVEAVLAQRLVRKICSGCRRKVDPLARGAGERGMVEDAWIGVGCDKCRGTGYRGRTGIYEILLLNQNLRDEIVLRHGAGELRRQAIAHGMHTLADDGMRLVRAGVTTLEEVLRVVDI